MNRQEKAGQGWSNRIQGIPLIAPNEMFLQIQSVPLVLSKMGLLFSSVLFVFRERLFRAVKGMVL